MSYGEIRYLDIKGAPDFLEVLGQQAVFCPKQDGYLPHYAFLDKDNGETFTCGTLTQLVSQAEKIRPKEP